MAIAIVVQKTQIWQMWQNTGVFEEMRLVNASSSHMSVAQKSSYLGPKSQKDFTRLIQVQMKVVFMQAWPV